jgi:hypothetical protein
LAFDNDDSGRKAAFASTSRFLNAGVFVRYFNYEGSREGDDPGSISTPLLHRGVRTATTMMPESIWLVGQKS